MAHRVPMAEIPKTLKKLGEARFFLALMKNAAKFMDFEREDFEFYLSAFLSAGRSVTFCLCSDLGGKKIYKHRFDVWWSGKLTDEQRDEMDFLRDQRNLVLKTGRTDVVAEIEMVPITQIETQPGTGPIYSIFQWWGEPDVPPPRIGMKVHYFTSGATREQVIAKCTRYLELLERLVREI
jgi:hypothetical protein